MSTASESADAYRGLVAVINENWRIVECHNGIQWILQHRGSPEKPRADDWRGRRYHRNAAALIISTRALCDPIQPSAWTILEALPERFVERERVPA